MMARATAITIPSGSSSKNDDSGSLSPSSASSGASTPQATSPALSNEDALSPWIQHRRRPRLLSTSFSRAEHTTFDLGMRDGSPRVITYVKTSQGFDWNQDIFLPSSSDITIHNGINHPEQVVDIILTDDDRFLPQ